jgi:hypothetical protein
MEGRMEIYEKIKEWLDLAGVKFGVGTGFSLSKMKATPYLKISFAKWAMIDFGPVVSSLGELGLTAGMKISKSDAKAKIWIDAGAVTDFDKLKDLKIPKLGFFAGFRLTF